MKMEGGGREVWEEGLGMEEFEVEGMRDRGVLEDVYCSIIIVIESLERVPNKRTTAVLALLALC